MVKQLFSEAKRDEVIEALSSMRAWQVSRGRSMTDEEKEKIRSLMQRLAVVNRVMSSDSVVKVLEFRSYCLETYEQILNDFPFASVSETVHRLLNTLGNLLFSMATVVCFARGREGRTMWSDHVERQNRQYGSRKVSLAKGNEDTFRQDTLHIKFLGTKAMAIIFLHYQAGFCTV